MGTSLKVGTLDLFSFRYFADVGDVVRMGSRGIRPAWTRKMEETVLERRKNEVKTVTEAGE